jgi:arginyl-tRNA synthetase
VSALVALHQAVEAAAADLRNGGEAPRARPTLERPPRPDFGDYSTNAAMLLARSLGAKPRDVAERLGEALRARLGPHVERVEVAGPGFLNVFLADAWYESAVADLLAAGDAYGAGSADPPEQIHLEFVSANPTGPLTAASGRHAAFGDALGRLLELAGHAVHHEYYFNDGGSQMRRLGESIRAWARGEPVPEDGYRGEYVRELAEALPGAADADPDVLARRGGESIMAGIRATLDAFRVRFDEFFLEGSLLEGAPSPVEQALAELERRGATYRADGALWLRTTAYGDDKDRVLTRSTGEPTYFASDVAYHANKLARGFDRMINVLGADHHGYVARVRASIAALGAEPERLEVPILQFVHIVERGQRASMSKRRGDFVTLDELEGEIGVDATRFFMLSRSADSTVDLDLDLARQESNENPVYYVQYAHARIASMLRRLDDERIARAVEPASWGEDLVLAPAERELVKALVAFPGEVAEAAARRAPHRVAAYVLELAQAFTAFYRDCRVVGAEPAELESFRVALSLATQRVIARSLGLLGVSAPESM